MKKTRSFVAFLLALSFLAPSGLLLACDDNTADAPPSNGVVGELPDADNGETDTEDSDDTIVEEEPAPVVEYAQYIRCTGENVNIRSGAGTSFTTLGVAEKGETYAVVGKIGNWYKTYYRNQVAYIYASYAAVFSLEKIPDQQTERVISEGYKLLGVPYVYGAVRLHDGKGKLLSGFSVQKFDCSSLVQYIFYQGAGKLLQVNTRTQVSQGTYVKPSDLQRGDCIYFTNEQRKYLTGIERVGHVAVYLGNNYILHTSSDYARIEKMTTARWNYYIEARRFI